MCPSLPFCGLESAQEVIAGRGFVVLAGARTQQTVGILQRDIRYLSSENGKYLPRTPPWFLHSDTYRISTSPNYPSPQLHHSSLVSGKQG